MNQTALLNFITNNQNNTPDEGVKAYLKYITFDYQFMPVGSDVIKVAENLAVPQNLYVLVPILKNGYIYVWLSNVIAVDFDHLSVTQYTNSLLEENTYNPFGLLLGGISTNVVYKNNKASKYISKQFPNSIYFGQEITIAIYQCYMGLPLHVMHKSIEPRYRTWFTTQKLVTTIIKS